MIKLSEAQVTKQAKDFLEAKGWMGIRLQSGTVRGLTRGTYMTLNKPGTPDWFFVRGPQYFFLELKKSGGMLGDAQISWFIEARRNNLLAIWCDGIEALEIAYADMFDA